MKIASKICLVLLFLIISTFAYSQPGGGGNPGRGKPVPITGIEYLLAAGGLLGAWKLGVKRFFRKS
jgi:hypothetical protein